jgi:hypothetical protein
MKTLHKTVSMLALLAPIGLFTPACVDDVEDFEDDDQLRPAKNPCPPCYVGGNSIYLGIHTDYSPSSITNTTVVISNAADDEVINYGSSFTVPNDPNTVQVTDNDLCIVDGTSAPPSRVDVYFTLNTAVGSIVVTDEDIPIVSTCS